MAQTTKASAIGGGLTCHERLPPGADVPEINFGDIPTNRTGADISMTRLPIGHPARVIGMDSLSMIVGCVWRNGGIVYALSGVAGVWPSWLVVAV